MKTLGATLRELREEKGLLLREVAAQLQVDPSFLSKIERGDKKPTREQVINLAKVLTTDEKNLLVRYLSEKVVYEIENEYHAIEALKGAERIIRNRRGKNI